MNWRYQPVIVETDINGVKDSYVSLCEVYLNKKGKLKAWTEDPSMKPVGSDSRELRGTLALMMNDARRWKAVKFNKLKVGMKFKRRKEKKR